MIHEKFAIDGYPESYERFGAITQLKQVPGMREPMKLYQAVKASCDGIRFDHCTFWFDGRHFYLLVEFYGAFQLQLHPDFVSIRVPSEFSPYHKSRTKAPGDICSESSILIGYADTKTTLDSIKHDLELAIIFRVGRQRGRR